MKRAYIQFGTAWLPTVLSVGHLETIHEALVEYEKVVIGEKLDATPGSEVHGYQRALDDITGTKLFIESLKKRARITQDAFDKDFAEVMRGHG